MASIGPMRSMAPTMPMPGPQVCAHTMFHYVLSRPELGRAMQEWFQPCRPHPQKCGGTISILQVWPESGLQKPMEFSPLQFQGTADKAGLPAASLGMQSLCLEDKTPLKSILSTELLHELWSLCALFDLVHSGLHSRTRYRISTQLKNEN